MSVTTDHEGRIRGAELGSIQSLFISHVWPNAIRWFSFENFSVNHASNLVRSLVRRWSTFASRDTDDLKSAAFIFRVQLHQIEYPGYTWSTPKRQIRRCTLSRAGRS